MVRNTGQMLFALTAMIVLFVVGLRLGELGWKHIAYCLLAAGVGLLLFGAFRWHPVGYTAVLAVIDVVLIVVIFKGDITIR